MFPDKRKDKHMAYKQAAQYDAKEFIEKLSDIRETVATERKKRLAGTATSSMLSTFHSGQENAPSKRGANTPRGFGNKKW